MARTLIGQLVLRLKTEGLGEAGKVKQTLRDVEDAARRMGQTGVGSWGTAFQKQLGQIRAASGDIKEVERSWIRLHESIKSRSLDKAAQKAEVSHWKTNTLAALAQQKADIDKHFADVEKSAHGHGVRMGEIMKAAYVAMGFYTLYYGAGLAAREGLTASSERRRELFRQRMANIPEGEQQKLFDASEAAAQKYPSIDITAIMELSRSAYSTMGNADRAVAILDKMVASLVVLQSARGPEAAANHLISLIRGLDNLGVNKGGEIGEAQMNEIIEEFTRAAQVDSDFDMSKFLEWARSTKVAGPALSMGFLGRSSAYIQDGTRGNDLAMGFKAFALEAVGSAGGKKYLAERDRIGIREGDKLVDSELYGSDPDIWALKYLVPALKNDGVDMTNETAVATAIGKLSGNTTATGFLTRVITQQEQIVRWLAQKDNALGTDVAKDVRFEDPFVGLEAFKKSFENLAAALVPIDSINSGLNSLADSINALARMAEDNPGLTALGIGGTAAGAVIGGKYAFDKLGNAFGLRSAASELTLAAKMLQRASGRRGGPWDDIPGGGEKKNYGGILGRVEWVDEQIRIMEDLPNQLTPLTGADRLEREYFDRLLKLQEQQASKADGEDNDSAWRRFLLGAAADPKFDAREHFKIKTAANSGSPEHGERATNKQTESFVSPTIQFGDTISEAQRTGAEILAALSVSAKPNIDLASLLAARDLAQQTLSLIRQIGTAAQSSSSSADRQMRRNMSDFGVSP